MQTPDITDAETSGQLMLDPVLTMALAMASQAAYDDFHGKPLRPPTNWEVVEGWTGWDPSVEGGREEKYGLVLRHADDSGAFIFAFRGTASMEDVLEDIDFPTIEFVQTDGGPSGARVSAGFYRVYNSVGVGMARSMRAQLQQLLQQFAPARLWITGHSLGGALAHLFAFDLSFDPASPPFFNLTFASPRVGDAAWHSVYSARIAPPNSIRVYNQHDVVPDLPPQVLGYHTVGVGFAIAFQRRGVPELHPLPKHTLPNLIVVLGNALNAGQQVWAGTFPDASDPKRWMISTAPKLAGPPIPA